MSQSKILVVDDEPNIVQTVQAYLEREGFAVYAAADGPTALKAAHAFQPDLIVLDIMLPGIDGLEVLRQVRQTSEVYVLLLTAKADETDKIIGLTVGADDYLTKPFSPRELVARIKAILRRERGSESNDRALVIDDLRIDPESRQVWKNARLIELTTIEFDILHTRGTSCGTRAEPRATHRAGLGIRLLRRRTGGGCAHRPAAQEAG